MAAATVALLPLHPLAAVAMNALASEAAFAREAAKRPEKLRSAHRRHVAVGTLAMALFVGEELAPRVPLVHCVWHCAGAAALAGFRPLLLHNRAEPAGAGGAAAA